MDIREKLAKELYDWVGRFGGHQGVLWEQATETVRREYFTGSEFMQKEFGITSLEPPADQVEAVKDKLHEFLTENLSDRPTSEIVEQFAYDISQAFVVKLPKNPYRPTNTGFAYYNKCVSAIRQANPGIVFKEE